MNNYGNLLLVILVVVISSQLVTTDIHAAEEKTILVFEDEENSQNEARISIVPNSRYILDDNTSISFNGIHGVIASIGSNLRWPPSDAGLPYITLGSDLLEIQNFTRIINGKYAYTIEIEGCSVSGRMVEDMAFSATDSCDLKVQRKEFESSKINLGPLNFTARTDFKTETDDLFQIYRMDDGRFLVFRFLGYYLGNVDGEVKPGFPESFIASFDIVSSYGVKKVDLGAGDYASLWNEESVVIGPEKISFMVMDVSRGNANCVQLCRGTFDMKINVDTIDDHKKYPTRILAYAAAGMRKPEFIDSQEVPLKGWQSPIIGYPVFTTISPGETLTTFSNCKNDEIATKGYQKVNTGNARILSAELVVNDPDKVRGENWTEPTSLKVIIENKADKGSAYVVNVHCEKLENFSPKKQLSFGALPENIKCKTGFVSIYKKNNSISCLGLKSLNRFLDLGLGHLVNPLTQEELANQFLSQQKLVYAKGTIVYDEIPKWNGSHYRLELEQGFGIPVSNLDTNTIVLHSDKKYDQLIGEKVLIKGVFLEDYAKHDCIFHLCKKPFTSERGLFSKEIKIIDLLTPN